ncbi:MAG: asparagine--tRNA ligase [Deltaproteobacteria bacterium]|jgi:asparaginyl-tRNA synthetase|nr:asparagine--tRNA ligase [Deltaproteobacteria bacterium]
MKPSPSLVAALLKSDSPVPRALVRGWVRTRRDAKGFSFVELNDGSCLGSLQLIVPEGIPGAEGQKDITTGAALEAEGELAPSQGKGQRWELVASRVKVLGPAGPGYPLQKKRHSDEFLREKAHLRARTNKFGAVFRLRSLCSGAVHAFFRERGFFHVHTPIITGNDCEGAGELFSVTAGRPAAAQPCGEPAEGRPGSGEGAAGGGGFFGRPASLTVSGQLEAELLALALGRVYTFGPAFRAENSNTPRHAAEFWMIEPEAAFFDLEDDMDLAEGLVRHVVGAALREGAEDLSLFDRFVEPGLVRRLEGLLGGGWPRISYREAVDILLASGGRFEFPPVYGSDLQTEHERFLCETHFRGPVFVSRYPASIKPFYMRQEEGGTVGAMDLLVPRVGELVGGSQREERLPLLLARMEELGQDPEAYWWYLDSRRWGGAPHSGFGLGFERLLMLVTGVPNIRDVIPFPRTPGNLEF